MRFSKKSKVNFKNCIEKPLLHLKISKHWRLQNDVCLTISLGILDANLIFNLLPHRYFALKPFCIEKKED